MKKLDKEDQVLGGRVNRTRRKGWPLAKRERKDEDKEEEVAKRGRKEDKRWTKERMEKLDKKEEVAKEIWLPILLHPLVDLLTTCEAFVANYFSSKLHHQSTTPVLPTCT